jgi:hypothetical protein
MTQKLPTIRQLFLLIGIFASIVSFSQTNCYLQISSSAVTTLCPGSPIVLTATTAAVNVGTGSSGVLNVSSTVYADATRAAIVGANTTGANNKVRVASTSGFAVGNEVMLITMLDPNTSASNLVGQYDFATISAISLDTLIFSGVLTKSYNASGSIKHQVIKVPHYTNITILNGGVLTCNNWDGATGGVLVFRANGTVNINAGGTIHANGKGYRAVAQKAAFWRNANGGQGEGIYGTGIGSGVNGAGPCNNSAAWNNANGNGGGGGTGCGDSGGGGGGGYASAGAVGVNNGHTPGNGGNAIGNSSVTLLYMGGAGGEGGADEDGAYSGSGGNGGGVVFFSANSLVANGGLQSVGNVGNNGSNASPGSGCGSTAGGGGAGGSIVLQINSFSGSGSNINATGGAGGLSVGGCNSGGATGGAGSNGRIRVEIPSGSVVTNPTSYQVTVPVLSGLSYLWSNSASQQSASVSPNVTSVYNVTITGGSSCVGTTSSFTVPVFSSPNLAVSGSNTVCAGNTIVLNANGANTYTWVNSNSNGNSLSVNPTSQTIYTLTGKSSQGCLGAPATYTVDAFAAPVLSISGNATICAGETSVLTANGADNYVWLNSSNTNANISVSPTSNTTYSLTGTNIQGCSGVMTTLALQVNARPVVSIAGSNTICAGESISLSANGANTYTWLNTNSNGTSISDSPSGNTTYSLSGTDVNGCVSDLATLAVAVYSLPVVSISGTAAICSGESAILSASGANTYTWLALNDNNVSITVNPTSTTSYSLIGTSSNGCAGSTATLAVAVYSLPTLSISGSSTLCSGSNLSLNANGASTYTWVGLSSNASVLTDSPSSNFTYSLSGTNAQGCVGSLTTLAVTVYSLPILSVLGTNTICLGGNSILTANGANSYTWSNTGSNLSTLTISPSANTNYTLNGTSGDGCLGTPAVLAVTVYSLPLVAISGSSVVCSGNSTNLTALGATNYTWTNSGSNNSSISINPTSSTVYSLIGVSVEGCSGNTATLAVNVYSLPVLSITGTSTLCSGSSVLLSANGASTYTWTNNNSNGSTQNVNPTANSIYSLDGTSSQGCVGTTATLAVTVYSLPTLAISGTNTMCLGGSVSLLASGATTYTWANTGSNVTTLNPSPSSNTTYTLIGSSSQGCSGNSATLAVAVYSLPVVAITGTNAICAGGTANLTASGAATFTWVNSGSNASTISVNPSTASIYSLTGQSTQGCAGTTATLSVNVFTLPILSITGTNTLCAGSTISLNANGASTYTWLNSNSTGASQNVSPTSNTTYSIIGLSSQGCAGNTASLATTVYSVPVVAISGTNAMCAGSSATLTANGASSYTWTNSNVNTTTLSVNPSSSITYSLIGKSSTGCSGNTATLSLTVNPNPTVSITGTTAICFGKTSTLTAAGASSYSWSTGSTNTVISLSPNTSTNYSVTGNFATGCKSSQTLSLTVYSNPTVITSGNSIICSGDTTVLFATGASSYSWSSGATTASVSLIPNSNTTYTIVGTDLNGCMNTTIKTITVNSLPVLVINGNTALCAGDSIALTVSGANSYSWTNGAFTNSTTITPTLSAGYAMFGLTGLSTQGCKSILNDSILVNAVPSLTITGGSYVCNGSSLNLTVGGAVTYSWSNGSTSNVININPTSNTSFSVVGTNSLGCMSMAVNNVSVIAFPTVSIVGNTVMCSGDSLVLMANGANTYSWSTGSTGSIVTVSPNTTATYTLVGEVGVGCSDSVQETIKVNSLPSLTLSIGTTTICNGESIDITVNGADSYVWSTSSTSPSISVSPTITTSYSVVGTSNDNCSSKTSVLLEVSECTGLSKNSVAKGLSIYPNPVNSTLNIVIGDNGHTRLDVVNSLGQTVLHQNVIQTGSINMSQFDNGLYFVRVTYENGVVETKTIVKQ